MIVVVLGVLVSLACAIASARRLWLVARPTAIEPEDLLAALGEVPSGADYDRVRDVVSAKAEAEWERDLFAALAAERSDDRAALVNEQLTELDFRIQRWGRVPAICARLATSSGFLFALAVLRGGIDAGELEGDVGVLIVRGFVGDALTVIAIGLVGAAFCVGADRQARRMARERSRAADRMVERLEALRGLQALHSNAAASVP